MHKINLPERPGWRERATEVGFTFADMGGEPYWDETSAYRLTLRQIEDDIEDPATDLHAMCREAVAAAVVSEEWMERLAIPRPYWDFVERSWAAGDVAGARWTWTAGRWPLSARPRPRMC